MMGFVSHPVGLRALASRRSDGEFLEPEKQGEV